MALDTTDPDGDDERSSVGLDAVSLARYSAIEAEYAELIIYDEEANNAWIQSDTWADAEKIA